MKQMKFNPKNKGIIRQVLYQTFPMGQASGLNDIYSEANCLREMGIDEWDRMKKYLLDKGLISESMENEYFRLTDKGDDVLEGR